MKTDIENEKVSDFIKEAKLLIKSESCEQILDLSDMLYEQLSKDDYWKWRDSVPIEESPTMTMHHWIDWAESKWHDDQLRANGVEF